jgi:hypothetical protein
MTNLFSVLGREQGLGESDGRILHQQGVSDPGLYAGGIARYAQAKAAFDGLIEETKAHLAEDIDLAEVPGFEARVQGAVNQRTAFTDYVAEKLIGRLLAFGPHRSVLVSERHPCTEAPPVSPDGF